jgi:hypothetical protein
MKKTSFAGINIQFLNKAVQDAIRRCERIVVVGPSDEYQKIYFFTGKKNYFRYYSIDLRAIDNVVPKRFQQSKRDFYDEVLRKEPFARAVDKGEAIKLFSISGQEAPVTASNIELVHWVKDLLAA